MSYPTDRIQLFDRLDNPLPELSPSDVFDRVRIEEINGEHSLTIVTSRVIDEETRALTVDGTGKWYEWVLDEPDELHSNGKSMIGTYRFVWSLQHDLQSVYGAELRPGIPNPVAASVALEAALNGTSRWSVGTVDVVGTGGLSMYDNSAWERLSDLISVFGGEVDAEIEVGSTGVISRHVSLRAHLGSTTVTRRFDWTKDLKSIRRKPAPGPRFCRVIPRGKGEQIESSTGEIAWTRRINIKSVNYGVEYLADEDAELAFRMPDGSGGYEYPTIKVVYEDIEDPQELKDRTLADIHNYTRPVPTYEADVLQLALAGMNTKGVALGDDIHIVDRGFAKDVPLRLEGRVLRYVVNEISKHITLTIGSLSNNIANSIIKLEKGVTSVANTTHVLEAGGTAEYLNTLINRLNEEINATGGYTYIVQGSGIRTYDVAVSDPLVGAEATKVVEIKGGTVRIADSRTAHGEWDWRSVFQAGRIASEMVVGGQIQTGYLRNADGSFYADLDGRVVNIGPSPLMGETALQDLIDDARRYATDYLTYADGELTLGTLGSVIRNVMTSTRQAYRTDAGDIAWYGLDSERNIWKFFIDNAQVNDMLQFGGFAWIARENGNMTIKWVGD